MKRDNFEKVGTILNGLIKKTGLEKRIREEMVLSIWKDVVGKMLSKHTRPSHIHNGILFIEIDNHVLSNEVNLLKEEMIKRLNDSIGCVVVKRICLRLME